MDEPTQPQFEMESDPAKPVAPDSGRCYLLAIPPEVRENILFFCLPSFSASESSWERNDVEPGYLQHCPHYVAGPISQVSSILEICHQLKSEYSHLLSRKVKWPVTVSKRGVYLGGWPLTQSLFESHCPTVNIPPSQMRLAQQLVESAKHVRVTVHLTACVRSTNRASTRLRELDVTVNLAIVAAEIIGSPPVTERVQLSTKNNRGWLNWIQILAGPFLQLRGVFQPRLSVARERSPGHEYIGARIAELQQMVEAIDDDPAIRQYKSQWCSTLSSSQPATSSRAPCKRFYEVVAKCIIDMPPKVGKEFREWARWMREVEEWSAGSELAERMDDHLFAEQFRVARFEDYVAQVKKKAAKEYPGAYKKVDELEA